MIKSRVQIYMPVDGFNFISVPGNQSPDLTCLYVSARIADLRTFFLGIKLG